MKKTMILLLVIVGLLVTGCSKGTKQDVLEFETEETLTTEEAVITESNITEESVVESDESNEMMTDKTMTEETVVTETTVNDSTSSVVQEKNEPAEEITKPVVDEKTEKKPVTESTNTVEKEEPEEVLENAPHPFFEVFMTEHCYEDDGEYYYWGFYMPYGCDTDNSPEYDAAYSEVLSKMKGERCYVFHGLDGEFADLGKYSFVRIGYKVPTECMPETLTILHEDNVYWGEPGYIVYYTEEEWNSEKWNEVYEEFHNKYVVNDEEGRTNLYHDTRYFADGVLKCFFVWGD